jgi:sec-independent protein translocase protein TatC
MPTFFDHLAELRAKLLVCCFAVLAGAGVAHYFHETLIAFLLQPVSSQPLFFLSPLDPLLFILKVDLSAGFLLALPVISWSVLSFVKPAIERTRWLLFSVVYGLAAVLILAGLAYSYVVLVPVTLHLLTSISVPGVENMLTATSYLRFLLAQSVITAVLFQIPLVVVAGSHLGAFRIVTLASKRRYIYGGGLVVLAVITPTTDVFSLGLVAIPAIVLFEGSMVVGRAVRRFKFWQAAQGS